MQSASTQSRFIPLVLYSPRCPALTPSCLPVSCNNNDDNTGAASFQKNCIEGLEANEKRIGQLLNESLMLATILNRRLGYDNVAKCAKKAHKEGKTLKEAVVELKMMTPDEFDQEVRPELMLYPD